MRNGTILFVLVRVISWIALANRFEPKLREVDAHEPALADFD